MYKALCWNKGKSACGLDRGVATGRPRLHPAWWLKGKWLLLWLEGAEGFLRDGCWGGWGKLERALVQVIYLIWRVERKKG